MKNPAKTAGMFAGLLETSRFLAAPFDIFFRPCSVKRIWLLILYFIIEVGITERNGWPGTAVGKCWRLAGCVAMGGLLTTPENML